MTKMNTKTNNEWEKIEELLFDLHIRFCPFADTEDNPIKQAMCNAHKDELREAILSLLQKALSKAEVIKEIEDRLPKIQFPSYFEKNDLGAEAMVVVWNTVLKEVRQILKELSNE